MMSQDVIATKQSLKGHLKDCFAPLAMTLRKMCVDEFIDEAITVQAEELTTAPKSFVWRDARYEVAEVLKSWQDWHTPPGAKHAQRWMHRRHRNCFVVRTTDRQMFEIYLDRGSGKRNWVLYKRVTE